MVVARRPRAVVMVENCMLEWLMRFEFGGLKNDVVLFDERDIAEFI